MSASLVSSSNIGLIDAVSLRQNLRQWAGTQTQSWCDLSDAALRDRLSTTSQLKRFLEKYCVDRSFREALQHNPSEAIQQAGLAVALQDVESLWIGQSAMTSEALQHFFAFGQERLHWSELQSISAQSSHAKYRAWRSRQIERTQREMPLIAQNLAHIPVCFELSQGCSVGCSFCAISASSLQNNFYYTPENAKLWRSILQVLQDLLGTAASAGFCYWATDPLDNPDYEQFAAEFHAVLGIFPQTTTAQPTKYPERLRSLLKHSLEKGCKLNRLSILSAKILDRVYKEFTAEELAFVGIVPQNPEAVVVTQFPFKAELAPKINAGRTFGTVRKQPVIDGTIACVSGFLINLVTRSVQLISPCKATPEVPRGYIVYDEDTFTDSASLRSICDRMIDQQMS